ncbi:MAG TPA: class I SAM-dependent methyltransferase [Planctomycetota bacterium]
MTPIPIHELYERDPDLYDALTRRDFAAQADVLRGLFRSPAPRVLELFAGPARHARALKAAGAVVRAVDDSPAMRAHALADGGLAPADYVRARLPRLPVRGRFDGALMLQFAAGLLEPAALETLAVRLAAALRPGAPLVFELRRPSALRGPAGTVTLPWTRGRALRLTCPDVPVAWSDDDWTMELTLRVDVLRAGAVAESRRYRMSERLVLPGDLRRLAERTKLYAVEATPPDAARAFPDSLLVTLRRR